MIFIKYIRIAYGIPILSELWMAAVPLGILHSLRISFYSALQRTLVHSSSSKCYELPAEAGGRAAMPRDITKRTLHQNPSIGITLFRHILMWDTAENRLPPLDPTADQIAISNLPPTLHVPIVRYVTMKLTRVCKVTLQIMWVNRWAVLSGVCHGN
jgi:hypothetical protein